MKDGEIIKWQRLVKYQNLLINIPLETFDLLEVMQELVPIQWRRDRLGTFLRWKRDCRDLGLINIVDEHKIIHEMVYGCGGL